ncbi:MAG: DMT family transporter, partial [Oscillospiraceae bacterium]|nr:DMT family transporter [Oscillospiraceae bacterium]
MNKTAGGHIAAFITILIWGTTFISTKVLLQAFQPIEILLLRFIMGYLVLWCFCPKRMVLKDRKQEYYFAAAGLCGVTLYYLLENVALTYTSASNVGVIISLSPFFTALFSCVFLHSKRPGIRFFLGFSLALTGIFLLSFNSAVDFQLNPLGDILAVAAAVVWAAYATLSKRIGEFGYPIV